MLPERAACRTAPRRSAPRSRTPGVTRMSPVSVSPWISTCLRVPVAAAGIPCRSVRACAHLPSALFHPRNVTPARQPVHNPDRWPPCILSTVGADRVNGRSQAEWVSYLLEPKNWIIATTLAIGSHAAGAGGLAWGAVAALFAGVLPMVFISRGVRPAPAGRPLRQRQAAPADRARVHHRVGRRGARGRSPGFGAPRELSGYIGCMLASVALLAAITTVWKISIHCAVAAGSVTILALLFGPWLVPAYLLVALTGLVAGGAQGPQRRPGDRGLGARRGRRGHHLRADPAPVTALVTRSGRFA